MATMTISNNHLNPWNNPDKISKNALNDFAVMTEPTTGASHSVKTESIDLIIKIFLIIRI